MPRPARKLPKDDRTIILYSQKMPAGALRMLREMAEADQRNVSEEMVWVIRQVYSQHRTARMRSEE